MADKQIQSFVGSRSAWDNLQLIPADSYPPLHPLRESDRSYLFDGLEDALESPWLDKIWEMIWRRWQEYETFLNKK